MFGTECQLQLHLIPTQDGPSDYYEIFSFCKEEQLIYPADWVTDWSRQEQVKAVGSENSSNMKGESKLGEEKYKTRQEGHEIQEGRLKIGLHKTRVKQKRLGCEVSMFQ